jgi:hypothetical protein
VPPVEATDVERNVRQADLVPWNGNRRPLRTELEDLEDSATGNPYPANLAARSGAIDAKECPHTLGRGVRDAHERTTEDVPVKPDGLVEVGHGDADVAEGSDSHSRLGGYRLAMM